MKESMAIESLAAEWLAAELKTVTHLTRYRLMASERGYTDIDAVAIRADNGHLALAECKCQGQALTVYSATPKSYVDSLRDTVTTLFGPRNAWVSEPFQLGQDPAWSGLRRIDLVLVANVMVQDQEDADRDLRQRLVTQDVLDLLGRLPHAVDVNVRLLSTLDLILGMFDHVERWVLHQGWGARTGDHQLDLLRELVRYKNAFVNGGGHGASKRCRDASRTAIRGRFLQP